MKNIIFIFLFIFWPQYYSFCQNVNQGLMKYAQIIMPKDTNSYTIKNLELYFNQYESMVKKSITRQVGTDTTVKLEIGRPVGTIELYKSFTTRQMVSAESAFFQKVVVKDTLAVFQWQILSDTKLIGTFKCQKAETDFRGRHYTAWFAPEIPINNGPWKLQGLPGLILEAADSKGYVRFQFVSLTLPFSGNVIYGTVVPTGKQKIMDVDEFKKLVKSNEENFRMMVQSDPQIGDTTIKFDMNSIEIFPEK